MASMDNPNKWRRVDYSLEALAKQFDDGNIQELHPKQLKAEKYTKLEPTLATDLVIHGNGRYQMPIEKNLAHVSEDDFVKVAFIHKADVWLCVERIDDKTGIVYAKTCENWKKVLDLQQNQRVQVRTEHIIEVKFHGDDEEDSD